MEKVREVFSDNIARQAKGFLFRPAELGEVEKIAELERSVWGKEGASKDQLISRIETFPRGNFVAIKNEEIVAFCSIEYLDDISKLENFTWNDVTDNGYMRKSHKLDGDYVYGVNLSVFHKMSGYRLGNAMILFGLTILITDNKKGVFIGSRAPGFRAYNKRHPEVSIDEYIRIRRNGKLRDYELSIYEKEGFQILKALPGYFPDPDSLDNGVLVYWGNEVYDSPDRNLAIEEIWNSWALDEKTGGDHE